MKKRVLALALTALMILSLSACGGNTGKEGTVLRTYDGDFSETRLLYRMVKMLVEEHTDITVEIKDEMGTPALYQALISNESDLMVSYDGTVLTTFMHEDITDVPAGESIYEYVNRIMSEKEGIYLLEPIGLNNTYAVGLPQDIASTYNLNTITELAAVSENLVFGAEHEFFSEEGSAKFAPFTAFYGLNFKDVKPIDNNLKYSAVENGNIEVTIVYTTDGLNKKANLKVLEDDQNYFPPYNGALLVRDDLFTRTAEAAPNLKDVLNMLGGLIDNEQMTALTYAVDVDGRDVNEVAKEFLQTQNLIA